MNKVFVWPYHYRGEAIDTTSRSSNWSRELSPFLVGPIELWGGYVAQNFENAWQYSKVYEGQTPETWLRWAKNGWNSSYANRYPMGKGAKPLHSMWNGEQLGYIEARKRIYCPLYTEAVVKTDAYKKLKEIFEEENVHLRDFDGYNHRTFDMTYKDVLECETRKMGHAFVLAMLLENERIWEN